MSIDPGLRRLILSTLMPAFPGLTPPPWAVELLTEGLAGYVAFYYNIEDEAQLGALTAALREARPDVLLSLDEEGGDVTRLAHRTGSPYPGNAALGAVDDPGLTERVYRAIGLDLRACGFNLDLAPSVDVNTADDNPVIGTRSFGTDPARVSVHAGAAVAGLQSAGVAACAKHFPGHGATSTDSHVGLPTVDVPVELLRERDLTPFEAAIKAGTRTVMTAHIRVPALTGELPATFHRPTLVDLLRGELGFTGVLVSDALDMRGAAGVAGSTAKAAPRALAAGVDLLCVGGECDLALVEETVAEVAAAVSDGTLAVGRIEEAAGRVAELAAWTVAAAGTAPSPRAAEATGFDAARRAVRVDGSLDGLGSPLVVQLVDARRNMAVGRVPWGLRPHLATAEQIEVPPDDEAALDRIREAAGGRAVVLVGRNLHRLVGARPLIEALAATVPVVVVEMGWPSAWRPAGVRAVVTTFGASRANGRAAADVLGLTA